MAATVTTAPPSRSLSHNRIWMVQSTNLVTGDEAFVRLRSTGANSAGETLDITFGTTTLSFTLAATPDNSGFQLPVRTTETNSEYAEILAEAFRANQQITDNFIVYTVTISGFPWVVIKAKTTEVLTMTHTETIANLTGEDHSSAGPYLEENLRGVVEVWKDTGNTNTDYSLGAQHGIYDAIRGTVDFDLRSHFAFLKPHLPHINSLEDPAAALRYGLASDAFVKWYFRYADKYGSPAVAEKMKKYPTSFYTLHGSHSADVLTSFVSEICHLRTRKDGLLYWKPVAREQPDYIYFLANGSALELRHQVKIYWSDGSTENYVPFPGMAAGLTAGSLYWVGTGYRQLKLDLRTPPSAGAYIYRYEFTYQTVDPVDVWTVRYEVVHDCHEWGLNLLYANGLGGCETVWLGGKKTEGYSSTKEIAQRIRKKDWELSDSELTPYNQQGAPTWQASTLYYDDPYYLDHLRQLPLADAAWIIDKENQRFLPVIVQAGEIETVREDDRTLFALEFTLTAAWLDKNANF